MNSHVIFGIDRYVVLCLFQVGIFIAIFMTAFAPLMRDL